MKLEDTIKIYANNNLVTVKGKSIKVYDIFIKAMKLDKTKAVADFYGCDSRTLCKPLYQLYPELKGTGKSLKYKILEANDLRQCTKCAKIRSVDKFWYNDSKCSPCKRRYNKEYSINNKEKISKRKLEKYYSNWEENKAKANAQAQKRHAAKLKRTPNWADLEKIEDIYLNRPAGYHVDHIIPLQGAKVSGLHVETNLQYLTAEENWKKNNKFKVD